LEAISGKHSIDSLQKTAIFGTSHIIRKVQGADKFLARPGREKATATEDFEFHISLYIFFPEENIQYSNRGESLKSRIHNPIYNHNCRNISTIYIYNKTSIKRNILTIKLKYIRK